MRERKRGVEAGAMVVHGTLGPGAPAEAGALEMEESGGGTWQHFNPGGR